MRHLQLDFSKQSLEEVIQQLKNKQLAEWAKKTSDFLIEYQANQEFYFFTSGTTGEAKKIGFNKNQLKASAELSLNYFNLIKGNRVLLPLSVDYIAGKMMLVRAIEGKLNLTIVEPQSDPFIDLKPTAVFDFSVLVPLQIETLLAKNNSLKSLGKILIGGANLSENLIQKLQELKVPAWLSFGMTETLTHFALKPISPLGENHYTCLPNYSIHVDSKGALIIQNKSIFETEIISNDAVELINEHSFIWKGRIDNCINSGGIKIYPELIEEKLKTILSFEFIISALPNERLGEQVVMCYVAEKELNETKTLEDLTQFLSVYEVPKCLIKLDFFPKTKSGKIKRNEVKEKIKIHASNR